LSLEKTFVALYLFIRESWQCFKNSCLKNTHTYFLLLLPPLIPPSGIGTTCFHHVVIKIRRLFLRPTACLTSTLLETGVDANDCKCNRDQQLNVRVQTLSALTARPSSSSTYTSIPMTSNLRRVSRRIADILSKRLRFTQTLTYEYWLM
jgi:hypothetical protein